MWPIAPRPRVLTSVTSLPTGWRVKSMTTSYRSAGAIRRLSCPTGAASSPPSEPIWTNASSAGGAGSQGQPVVAGVGGVEQAKPVARVRHLEHRRTVDEDHVTQHTLHIVRLDAGLIARRVPGRVAQRAVRRERPVADHQRYVLVACGQRQRVTLVVAYDVEPSQPAVNLRAGEVHPMVVIPEGGGPLLHRVRVLLGSLLKRPAGPLGCAGGLAGGQQQVGWVAVVLRWGAAAVQVYGDRHGELVAVPYHRAAAPAGLDGRPGNRPS